MFKKFFFSLFAVCLCFFAFPQGDTNQVNQLTKDAWQIRQKNLDSAILLSGKALELMAKIPAGQKFPHHWRARVQAKNMYYLGIFLSYKGELPAAKVYTDRALVLSDSINDDHGRALANGGLGRIYMQQGNLPEALDYFFKTLRIDERMKHKEGISVDLANIGNIYDAKGDFDRALEYYKRALKINEELKDESRIALQLGNIGNIFFQKGDLDKALEYYWKSVALAKRENNKQGESRMLNNIASVYEARKDFPKALEYYQQALILGEEQGLTEHVADYIGNIGTLYGSMKQYKKAEEYLLRSIKLSQEIGSIEAVRDFEQSLSKVYSEQGKDRQALEHYKKFIVTRDSIINTRTNENLVRTEMNYEFDKKQAAEKAQHEKEIIAFEAENKIQKQLRLFLLIVIGMILVLLFFVKRAYDNKKRIAGFLESEAQRKEVMLQEVHHRINNNLQIISSLLTLQANSAKDERLYEYLQQSQNRIQTLSAMHELLFQTDRPMEINMKDYLDRVLDFHRDVLQSTTTGVNLNMNVAPVIFPTKVAVPVAIIVNELITNSIKYAFEAVDKGHITISLLQVEDQGQWALSVTDSGRGLPPEGGGRTGSLGLRLVSIMTRQMGGTLTKSNSPGATFNVTFSLSN